MRVEYIAHPRLIACYVHTNPGLFRRTTQEYKLSVYYLLSNNFSLSSYFTNYETPITIICNIQIEFLIHWLRHLSEIRRSGQSLPIRINILFLHTLYAYINVDSVYRIRLNL